MSLPIRSVGLIATGALLCVSLGVTVGAYVVAPPVPESLSTPAEVTSAMVSSRAFNDERTVRVTIKLRESEPVTTPLTGRVTSLFVAGGSSLTSGKAVMDVDGQRVIALHTATPLYREIADGITGEDISSLQEELVRLGYDIAITGKVNWWTRWALADLMEISDTHGGVPESVPHSNIVWLPAATVSVHEVKARLGDTLSEGAVLMTLSGGALSGSVTIPQDALSGARVLLYQDKSYPVADNGVVEDQELLSALAASPIISAGGSSNNGEGGKNQSEVSVSVPWLLAAPIEVQIVPAAALFGVSGDQACVTSVDGHSQRVKIIASELGQTFIQAESPLGKVTLNTEGLSCQ